jgi:hypothetical protein
MLRIDTPHSMTLIGDSSLAESMLKTRLAEALKAANKFRAERDELRLRMGVVARLEGAVEFLLDVKDHKDKCGKDDWYKDAQPIAWQELRAALANIKGIK